MRADGRSLAEALAAVKAVRPIAQPNEGFMIQLQRHETSLAARRARPDSAGTRPPPPPSKRELFGPAEPAARNDIHLTGPALDSASAASDIRMPIAPTVVPRLAWLPATALPLAPASQMSPRRSSPADHRSPPRTGPGIPLGRAPPPLFAGAPRSASAARAPPLAWPVGGPPPPASPRNPPASPPRNPPASPPRAASVTVSRAPPPASPRGPGGGPLRRGPPGWAHPGARDAHPAAPQRRVSPFAAPASRPPPPPFQPPAPARLVGSPPRPAAPTPPAATGLASPARPPPPPMPAGYVPARPPLSPPAAVAVEEPGLLGEVKRLRICTPGRPDVYAKELTC